jgi:hypothetical protein
VWQEKAMSKGWIAYWCVLAATAATAASVLALGIWETWNGLASQVQGAIVGGTFTALSAIIGVLVVVFQLKRQGENAVSANRATEAMKLKKDVYAELVAACKETLDDQRAFTAYVARFELDVSICRDKQVKGAAYQVPDARFAELLDRYFACVAKIDALIALQERWEIIEPRSSVFTLAFEEAKDRIDKAFDPYGVLAMRLMPQDQPGGAPEPWNAPDKKESQEIGTLGRAVRDTFRLLGNWVSDFQLEMQNVLFGEMFRHQAPARAPRDLKHRTLRLDQYEELRRYFTEETELGKREARMRAALSAHPPQAGA